MNGTYIKQQVCEIDHLHYIWRLHSVHELRNAYFMVLKVVFRPAKQS